MYGNQIYYKWGQKAGKAVAGYWNRNKVNFWGKPIGTAGRRFYGRKTYAQRYRRGRYQPAKEMKFHDLDFNVTLATTGNVKNSCNLIAQGVTESTRIGRVCNIRSIDFRYTIKLLATTTDEAEDVVRIIVYLDKQANGATATAADILEQVNIQGFNNLTNSGRFRFLHDRLFNLNATSGGGNGTTDHTYSHSKSARFFKRCNIPIEFSSTAGAITEIRSNNIGILAICRSDLTSLDSSMRILFTG